MYDNNACPYIYIYIWFFLKFGFFNQIVVKKFEDAERSFTYMIFLLFLSVKMVFSPFIFYSLYETKILSNVIMLQIQLLNAIRGYHLSFNFSSSSINKLQVMCIRTLAMKFNVQFSLLLVFSGLIFSLISLLWFDLKCSWPLYGISMFASSVLPQKNTF